MANIRVLRWEPLECIVLSWPEQEFQQISLTAQLRSELWSAAPGRGQPTGVALAVAGMNDVLNSQGYTQAYWNRIPTDLGS